MISTHDNLRLFPINGDPTAPVRIALTGQRKHLIATIKIGSFSVDNLNLLIGAKYRLPDGRTFYQPVTLDGFGSLGAGDQIAREHHYVALPKSFATFMGYRTLTSKGTQGNGYGDFECVHREVVSIDKPFPHMLINKADVPLYTPSALAAALPGKLRRFWRRHFTLTPTLPDNGPRTGKWLIPQKRL